MVNNNGLKNESLDRPIFKKFFKMNMTQKRKK
jgi:hypothetical protein